MRKIFIGSILILAAALSRLLPHPDNFTPIAAIALAGGVYIDKRFSLVITMAALLISDLFIGLHNTMIFVYGSFILIGFLGIWLKSHKKPVPILGATLFSSVLFFVITNFGVWLTGGGWFYPKTVQGLIECYTLALPFFRNTIVGDLAYTAVLFGLFEFVQYSIRVQEKKTVQI
ncbi:MAG: hypothetical protein EHM64_04700 [Ignavibacteriae bacterium]|nr:MAG: hypothetical protein EHM64_04700 [Ignavibacteriota bacterium]